MLGAGELKGKPFLIFANKMDVPTALSPVDIAQGLTLDAIHAHPWWGSVLGGGGGRGGEGGGGGEWGGGAWPGAAHCSLVLHRRTLPASSSLTAPLVP